MKPTAFAYARDVFHRVYTSHKGTEPEAFDAATKAVEPLIPVVREELGYRKNGRS